jgi:hypothetical protein
MNDHDPVTTDLARYIESADRFDERTVAAERLEEDLQEWTADRIVGELHEYRSAAPWWLHEHIDKVIASIYEAIDEDQEGWLVAKIVHMQLIRLGAFAPRVLPITAAVSAAADILVDKREEY